jgi:hypothetical protein
MWSWLGEAKGVAEGGKAEREGELALTLVAPSFAPRRFTLRIRKGISDRIWEDLVLAATGDQFEESDTVIGVVLSVRPAFPLPCISSSTRAYPHSYPLHSQVRAQEDVISVWTEKAASDGGAKLK